VKYHVLQVTHYGIDVARIGDNGRRVLYTQTNVEVVNEDGVAGSVALRPSRATASTILPGCWITRSGDEWRVVEP